FFSLASIQSKNEPIQSKNEPIQPKSWPMSPQNEPIAKSPAKIVHNISSSFCRILSFNVEIIINR
ncbi:hypothetical protein ABES03_24985, partial [Neobacillus rhizosphaerae]|uniref:hypothetical protein n=1 Tax=Neobacillus rhizosphaerae TaxID=2880965 RepID=UPI003D299B69